MHFAFYGRKSIYSDKSDSVSNQERMCREYADLKFHGKVDSFDVYQDEGFTGANKDRPGLKRLIEDIKAGMFDALVVYQLDRLSRNVRDFSNIYAILEEKHVMFVSIKENIDTATPIGKAMMYVTMVFAQMERETIAARVTDNLHGLAKRGLWTGGQTPTGYKPVRVEINGKKHYKLEMEPEGSALVKKIYAEYLSSELSLLPLARRLRGQQIYTPKGATFTPASLWTILTSPMYCTATAEAYDYFESLGCQMDPDCPRELWDGKRSVNTYGRRTPKGGHYLPKENWHICLGLHEPMIPADQWLAVQKRLDDNVYQKVTKYEPTILKGIVKCAKCGRQMKTNVQKCTSKKKGTYLIYQYSCKTRDMFGKTACDMSALNCSILDEKALDVFRQIEADPDIIKSFVPREASPSDTIDERIGRVKTSIISYEGKIKRLTTALADLAGSPAAKHVIAQIEDLDKNLEALRRDEMLLRAEEREAKAAGATIQSKAERIAQFIHNLDGLSATEKNSLAKELIRECVWDGETLLIRL